MKKQVLILIMGASMLIATPFAMAQTPKAAENTPIAVSKILQNLEAKGYVGLREVDLDNSVYKADVVTAEGDALDVKVNAMTGEVMGSKGTPNRFSIIDIAKKVEEAGYRITKIKADGDTYKVKALDKDDKKAALKVNAMTGEISKKWFD